jgi:hypothetical protein
MGALPMIRTSERGDWKDCQWYWLQHWVNGWTSPHSPTWSWFGTAIHVALSVRYQPGKKRASVADVLAAFDEALNGEVRRMYTEGIEPDEEEMVDARELGRAMLIGYMQHYGRDQAWYVVHNEQPFQIYVPHPTKPDRYIAMYCGTWDLVIWDLVDKCYRIVDHKTRRSFPQHDWSFYDLNDQGGSYLWVAPEVLRHKGIFGPEDRLDGIVFNCLRKAMPDERPKDEQGIYRNKPKKEHYVTALARYGAHTKMKIVELEAMAGANRVKVLGEPSLQQPGPLFHRYTSHRDEGERVAQAQHVIDESRIMTLQRRGVLPVTKHPTEACPRCPLFDMCQIDEKDPAEAQAHARATLVQQDAYAEHRRAMQRDGITL